MKKICNSCKIEKPLDDFHKNKKGKYGVKGSCKECKKEYHKKYRKENKEANKKYRQENKEKRKEYAKKYRQENKEQTKEYAKKWRQENKEQIRKYQKNRKEIDPLFKLSCNLRTRTYKVFKSKGYSKNTKTQKMLGVDWEVCKAHIERQFTKGMNWDNYGEWHIDHIIPLASAKTEKRLKELCHYTNLQPLWADDNFSKSDKIINQQTMLRI